MNWDCLSTDTDLIRPIGIDQTGTIWIRLAVPLMLAPGVASIWRDGQPFADFAEDEAIRLLRGNEAWRELNAEAVARLTPDLMPPKPIMIEPVNERDAAVMAVFQERENRRQRIDEELKLDARRTDRIIGDLVGVDRSTVGLRRRKLERAGEIVRADPASRVTRPRPTHYRTRGRRR